MAIIQVGSCVFGAELVGGGEVVLGGEAEELVEEGRSVEGMGVVKVGVATVGVVGKDWMSTCVTHGKKKGAKFLRRRYVM